VLEFDFADLADRQPELVAHHLAAAHENKRAVDQWLKAGRRAAARLGHVEALAHFERGLALQGMLPDTPERDAIEIELQLALGVSSITVKGMSSPSVPEAYGRARELAEKRRDERQLFQATYGLWQNAGASGFTSRARPLSDRLLQLAARGTDDGQHLQAHHSAWTTGFICGELSEAHTHIIEGHRLYHPERHQSHRHIYGGHDPGVCAQQTDAQVSWFLGYPDRAVARANSAMALAEELAHPFSREVALEYAAHVHLHRREPQIGVAYIATVEALRAEQRVSFVVEPAFFRGAVQLAQGSPAEAAAILREAFTPGKMPTMLWQPYGRAVLAEALMQQGEYREALSTLGEGFARIEATGERVWEAELHRINGLVLLAGNNLEEGETSFNEAIRVARLQQARSLELRATTDLARLWGEHGRRTEAHDLLAPIYSWFTEGFDTADLKEAKALLNMLV
jgi:predicted ATPase